MKKNFKALMVVEDAGVFKKEIKELYTDELPSNELLVKVNYSSVNYKDSLSASGNWHPTSNPVPQRSKAEPRGGLAPHTRVRGLICSIATISRV